MAELQTSGTTQAPPTPPPASSGNPNTPPADPPKRGRPPKVDQAAAEPEAPGAPVSEQVTYVPDKDDPPTTTWGGFKFTANVPVQISGHSGDPKKGECKPHERAAYELIEAARKNRFFRVGRFDPAKDSVPVREPGKLPETPDQYRAHAIAWSKTKTTLADFDTQWQGEEALRMKCGVGTDDLDLLQSVIGPIRGELIKRASFQR